MQKALRAVKGTALAAMIVVALGGCMHVTDTTVLAPNGSSTMTEAMTFSPKLLSQLGGEASLVKSIHAQAAKHTLPGNVKVAAFTDSSGWHGVKLTIGLSNLSQLRKLETVPTNGTAPLFSKFSITHKGRDWTMIGKVDKGSLTTTGSSSTSLSVSQLKAIGFTYKLTFHFPGKVVHDNATSRSGSTLTWNMLKDRSTVEAAWVVG